MSDVDGKRTLGGGSAGVNDADGAVVVPAIGAPSSVRVLRSLGGRGVHTVAVSEQESPPAFSSKYCEETVSAPSPSDDVAGYRDVLLSLVGRDEVRAVTPMRETDVYTLARYRSSFAEHVTPVWPSLDRLAAVHDRERLFDVAGRADVPFPETRRLDEVDDWDAERIVKGRYAVLTPDYVDSVPANGCEHPPKTIYLEPGEAPDVESIVDAMGHVPMAQEYVAGTEYCFRAICLDGDPVVTSQKRLVRGYKYPRGPSVYHEAVDVPRLAELGRALLAELEWTGPASVGFIRDESGTFRLLEVNPRFWSSLPMDVHAGVDYPHVYWRLARGELVDRSPEYEPGVASHLLRGEFAHLYSVALEEYPVVERPSVPGTLRDVATSLLRHPRFDLLSLEDPGPFVRDLLNAAGSTLPSFPISVDVDVSVGGSGGAHGTDDARAGRSADVADRSDPEVGDVAAGTGARSTDVSLEERSSG